MRFLTCRNCFRRAFTDNIATGYSAFRAYVDDVVGALNYFHVVLDNNDRMPSFLSSALFRDTQIISLLINGI